MMGGWTVRFSNKANKQYLKLLSSGSRPSITDAIDFLIIEIQIYGPERVDWPNYGKLTANSYHCHLRKGKPTYVACWTIRDKKLKQIEVYYVGTHENAPY